MSRRHPKRANGATHWVQLEHYLLDCAAWRDLTPNARATYFELKRRYNGRNNGEISFSSREAGKAINLSHHTGARAIIELVGHGFIVLTQASSFNRKHKIATCYRLTEHRNDIEGGNKIPSKEFLKWRPKTKTEKLEHSRMGETHSRMGETREAQNG